jgi:hypothetical protein
VAADASNNYIDSVSSFIKERYNLKHLNIPNKKFGTFTPQGIQREYFAYSLEKETPSSKWILTYVIQSNFGINTQTSTEAKDKSNQYISSLEDVFVNISQ